MSPSLNFAPDSAFHTLGFPDFPDIDVVESQPPVSRYLPHARLFMPGSSRMLSLPSQSTCKEQACLGMCLCFYG